MVVPRLVLRATASNVGLLFYVMGSIKGHAAVVGTFSFPGEQI